MKFLDFKWSTLSDVANFPFIKHSFFYIVITPIIATLIDIYFTKYSMPFNLLISYVGSLFLLLGRVLTILKLPDFIKNIPNYKTYMDLNLERNDLDYYSRDIKNTFSEKKYYDSIYKDQNSENSKYRIIISIFYIIGLICFVLLFIQGAVRVYQSI